MNDSKVKEFYEKVAKRSNEYWKDEQFPDEINFDNIPDDEKQTWRIVYSVAQETFGGKS